jgi:stage V sporulation protein G
MEITEVRVRLAERKQDRLRAFCSVTFDDAFVIRDVKVIQGDQGLFVAMPSRKLTDRCPSCRAKNQLRSRYCSDCGVKLPNNRAELDDRGRPRLYVDIAHPVNAEARTQIEKAVLAAYEEELVRSREPGYKPATVYEGELEEPEELDLHFGAEEQRPAERREPHERREPTAERREPTAERRESTEERREPTAERREPPRTPPSPPPKPPETKRRFGEGILEDQGPEKPASR